MKNSNIKTVNGMGKACSIISRIAMIFCIIGSVFTVVGIIGVLLIPTDKINLSGNADATVTIAVEDLDLNGITFSVNGDKNGFSIDSAPDGISIDDDKVDFDGVWSMNIDNVSSDDDSTTFKLSGDFSEFDKSAVKRKMVFGILEAFVSTTATAVMLGIAASLFKVLSKCETPFTEAVVKKTKVLGWAFVVYAVVIGVSLPVVISALAILMLAYVFAYGAQLQKESDETL
ncbi:MAG: hypothetical protein Q4A05_03795 [Ruminococcus sp.]|nr:hypothetical protein [Ruminococcus sp.]